MFYKVIFQVKTIHSSSVSILMGATMDLQGKKVQSRMEALEMPCSDFPSKGSAAGT